MLMFKFNRDVSTEQASANSQKIYSESLSVKRSRMRVMTAQKQLDALIAEDIAAYNAAFEIDEVRRNSADAKTAAFQPDRNDPSTWKRPNLDKLKASILADWGDDLTEFRGKSGFPALT